MSYSVKERNDAILLIANDKADLKKIAFYEDLESFNWIKITRLNNKINTVELTYAGKDLFKRLLKQDNS